MHRYTQILLQAFEKASKNIKRDILELAHLQNSPNLRTFINRSQSRFETNMAFELKEISISIQEKNGTFKNVLIPGRDFDVRGDNLKCTIYGIDSVINLSHGIEQIGFAASILEKDVSRVSAICMPYIDSSVYTESENDVFIIGPDGFSRRLKINKSINITMPYIVCATDCGVNESKIMNRETYFISSGSILCDAFRVLENKVDIAIHADVSEDYILPIRSLIRAAGGMDGFKDAKYIFGKSSLVQSML